MKLYKNIKLSWKALFIEKSRTIFSIIGISIGIIAVFVMISIGNGAKEEIEEQFAKMGTNIIIVNAGKIEKSAIRENQTEKVTTLKLKDLNALTEQCQYIKNASPSIDGTFKVKANGLSTMTMVYGVFPQYSEITNFPVEKGRYFTEQENKLSKRVAVIGQEIKKNLFSNEDPIGKTIRIENTPFEIIGVLIPKGASPDGANLDNKVLIPLNTAQRRVFNVDYINQIYISIFNQEQMLVAEKEIEYILREQHKLDRRNKKNDFSISNQLNATNAQKESIKMFNWLIAGVAGISLLVGGVGILSVMLLSVRDRTSEIGLRLSLGARKRDIIWQFLSESLILGLAGGVTGIIVGIFLSWILDIVTNWKTSITFAPVLLSVGFSIAIGLIFGIFPARKAAGLDPVTALQKE